MLPDGFDDEAKQRIGNGVGNNDNPKANWEVWTKGTYHSGKRLRQEGQGVHKGRDWLGLVRICEIHSPADRNEKTRNRPHCDSEGRTASHKCVHYFDECLSPVPD